MESEITYGALPPLLQIVGIVLLPSHELELTMISSAGTVVLESSADLSTWSAHEDGDGLRATLDAGVNSHSVRVAFDGGSGYFRACEVD